MDYSSHALSDTGMYSYVPFGSKILVLVLLFSPGMWRQYITYLLPVRDHIEDHKRDKAHREDRLIKNKQHQPSVHYERISIQWETHIWLKNILGFYFIIHLQVLGFLPILIKHFYRV